MADRAKRIGVLGVGFGSAVHVPAFRSEGWDVAAVYSRNEERARKAAADLGVADYHTDAMALIERDDLDAVAISTPPGPHHEFAIAALRAGKHVICEKPFAINAGQAAEMRDAASESGKTAMVAHEFRFTPQRTLIKELLDEGYVGEFQKATVQLMMGRPGSGQAPPVTWASLKAEGGGFLGALGSHYIDGLRYWFGDVATVRGSLQTFNPDRTDPATGKIVSSETDDAFSFDLTFKKGGVATMTASSTVSPSLGARIVVTGSDGVLLARQDGPNPAEDGVVLGGKSGDAGLQELPTPPRLTPFTDDRDPRLMAFRLLVREFERGIDDGVSYAPNFDDAVACQQVLDAVRESAESGKTVELA